MPTHQRNMALTIAVINDGRTTKQLAEACGMSTVTFCGVKTGRIPAPTANVRMKIAAGLNRPVAELFPDNINDPTPNIAAPARNATLFPPVDDPKVIDKVIELVMADLRRKTRVALGLDHVVNA